MRDRRVQSAAEMAPKNRQIVIRLESDLAERIDVFRERLQAETGLEVSHAAAVRRLLIEGLASTEKPRTKRGA